MALVLDATIGGASSNSYETVAEAQDYWDSRLFTDNWDNSDDQAAALVWATRVLDSMSVPHRRLIFNNGVYYYRTAPQWTGAPATSTQRLAWPRTGMLDRLGRAIPSNVIPQELKDAVSELAGQLSLVDRTLDSDVSVQGVTSVRAGSVSVSFKENVEAQVWPDVVWALLPDSWFTDELIEPALQAQFDVL